jgi:hypothetical protein
MKRSSLLALSILLFGCASTHNSIAPRKTIDQECVQVIAHNEDNAISPIIPNFKGDWRHKDHVLMYPGKEVSKSMYLPNTPYGEMKVTTITNNYNVALPGISDSSNAALLCIETFSNEIYEAYIDLGHIHKFGPASTTNSWLESRSEINFGEPDIVIMAKNVPYYITTSINGFELKIPIITDFYTNQAHLSQIFSEDPVIRLPTRNHFSSVSDMADSRGWPGNLVVMQGYKVPQNEINRFQEVANYVYKISNRK